MCIVSRGGDGDTAGTADIGVTQLVGQRLELVRVEPVVVPQDVVVRGATGALENNQMSIIIYNTKRGTTGALENTGLLSVYCYIEHDYNSSLSIIIYNTNCVYCYFKHNQNPLLLTVDSKINIYIKS